MSLRARHALPLAFLLASAGCDGFVRARVRVLSMQNEPVRDALLRRQSATDHDWARFTDADGCAYFSGVLGGPARHVRVTVGKPGLESRSFDLSIAREECLVVRLAQEGGGQGSVDKLAPDACPCDSKAGYSPMMSARFKVVGRDGAPVELVGVRRSDRPRNPWLQVTDANGCIGVRWIVPAGLSAIPLVLEKPDYRPAPVSVPTMEDRCYAVSLSGADASRASSVAAVDDNCGCDMFTGKTAWPEE
jgi:hypothetical protein